MPSNKGDVVVVVSFAAAADAAIEERRPLQDGSPRNDAYEVLVLSWPPRYVSGRHNSRLVVLSNKREESSFLGEQSRF